MSHEEPRGRGRGFRGRGYVPGLYSRARARGRSRGGFVHRPRGTRSRGRARGGNFTPGVGYWGRGTGQSVYTEDKRPQPHRDHGDDKDYHQERYSDDEPDKAIKGDRRRQRSYSREKNDQDRSEYKSRYEGEHRSHSYSEEREDKKVASPDHQEHDNLEDESLDMKKMDEGIRITVSNKGASRHGSAVQFNDIEQRNIPKKEQKLEQDPSHSRSPSSQSDKKKEDATASKRDASIRITVGNNRCKDGSDDRDKVSGDPEKDDHGDVDDRDQTGPDDRGRGRGSGRGRGHSGDRARGRGRGFGGERGRARGRFTRGRGFRGGLTGSHEYEHRGDRREGDEKVEERRREYNEDRERFLRKKRKKLYRRSRSRSRSLSRSRSRTRSRSRSKRRRLTSRSATYSRSRSRSYSRSRSRSRGSSSSSDSRRRQTRGGRGKDTQGMGGRRVNERKGGIPVSQLSGLDEQSITERAAAFVADNEKAMLSSQSDKLSKAAVLAREKAKQQAEKLLSDLYDGLPVPAKPFPSKPEPALKPTVNVVTEFAKQSPTLVEDIFSGIPERVLERKVNPQVQELQKPRQRNSPVVSYEPPDLFTEFRHSNPPSAPVAMVAKSILKKTSSANSTPQSVTERDAGMEGGVQGNRGDKLLNTQANQAPLGRQESKFVPGSIMRLDTIGDIEDEDKFLYGDDDVDQSWELSTAPASKKMDLSFHRIDPATSAQAVHSTLQAKLTFPEEISTQRNLQFPQEVDTAFLSDSYGLPGPAAGHVGDVSSFTDPFQLKQDSREMPTTDFMKSLDYGHGVQQFHEQQSQLNVGQVPHSSAAISVTDRRPDVPNVTEKESDGTQETLNKILQSIGFDFELSQLMQQKAKEKKQEEDPLDSYGIKEGSSFLAGGLHNMDMASFTHGKATAPVSTKDKHRGRMLGSQESYEERARRYRDELKQGNTAGTTGESGMPAVGDTNMPAHPGGQPTSYDYQHGSAPSRPVEFLGGGVTASGHGGTPAMTYDRGVSAAEDERIPKLSKKPNVLSALKQLQEVYDEDQDRQQATWLHRGSAELVGKQEALAKELASELESKKKRYRMKKEDSDSDGGEKMRRRKVIPPKVDVSGMWMDEDCSVRHVQMAPVQHQSSAGSQQTRAATGSILSPGSKRPGIPGRPPSASPDSRSSRSSSRSPRRSWSRTPPRRKSTRSPMRRRSRTPPRRRSSRSPRRSWSRTPPRRRSSRSPRRSWSRTPPRRVGRGYRKNLSRSPRRSLSGSPSRRSRSPGRRYSRSPPRIGGKQMDRLRSKSKEEALSRQQARLKWSNQQRLQQEMVDRKKKLDSLNSELEKLRKQQNELMRKRQREKDGHKDPVLAENNLMQMEISKKIDSLRADASQTGGGLLSSQEKARPSVPTSEASVRTEGMRGPAVEDPSAGEEKRNITLLKKPQMTQQERNATVEYGKAKIMDSMTTAKPNPEPTQETDRPKIAFKMDVHYDYVDGGDHWCRDCGVFCDKTHDWLRHIATKSHCKIYADEDRPWASGVRQKAPPPTAHQTIRARIKGTEFLRATIAYYCTLCSQFSGDIACAELHLRSEEHNEKFKKFSSATPSYEKSLDADKAAHLSNIKKEADQASERMEELRKQVEHKNKRAESKNIELIKRERERGLVPELADDVNAPPPIRVPAVMKKPPPKPVATSDAAKPAGKFLWKGTPLIGKRPGAKKPEKTPMEPSKPETSVQSKIAIRLSGMTQLGRGGASRVALLPTLAAEPEQQPEDTPEEPASLDTFLSIGSLRSAQSKSLPVVKEARPIAEGRGPAVKPPLATTSTSGAVRGPQVQGTQHQPQLPQSQKPQPSPQQQQQSRADSAKARELRLLGIEADSGAANQAPPRPPPALAAQAHTTPGSALSTSNTSDLYNVFFGDNKPRGAPLATAPAVAGGKAGPVPGGPQGQAGGGLTKVPLPALAHKRTDDNEDAASDGSGVCMMDDFEILDECDAD